MASSSLKAEGCLDCGGSGFNVIRCPNPECLSHDVHGSGCCLCEHTGYFRDTCKCLRKIKTKEGKDG